jgi:hypothetical protein
MNKPYVKNYNAETGELINPIKRIYATVFPNREQRRRIKQAEPFMGNSKGAKITVSGKFKYRRFVQVSAGFGKDGRIHTINHYALVG